MASLAAMVLPPAPLGEVKLVSSLCMDMEMVEPSSMPPPVDEAAVKAAEADDGEEMILSSIRSDAAWNLGYFLPEFLTLLPSSRGI